MNDPLSADSAESSSRSVDPVSAVAFEHKYRTSPDPWQFSTSAYEQHRYATTLESLQRTTYGTAFEPGCSIGALTALLSRRCRRVVATDVAPTAVARAKSRCSDLDNVSVRLAAGPTEVPGEPLDLVVFSEVGYYFEPGTLQNYAAALASRLEPGGEFIAVHWLGHSPDHLLHGDTVHDVLLTTLPLSWIQGSRHPGFRIDSWMCT